MILDVGFWILNGGIALRPVLNGSLHSAAPAVEMTGGGWVRHNAI